MLEGKIALVTGGGRGSGREIALTLAGYGADVAVNYSGSKEKAEETAELIRAAGRRAAVIQADISQREDCVRLFKEAAETLGPIDILVNNAGITRDKLMLNDRYEPERRLVLHAACGEDHDEKKVRQDRQSVVDFGSPWKRGADQLLCRKGGDHRHDEMPCEGARVPQCHGERGGSGLY